MRSRHDDSMSSLTSSENVLKKTKSRNLPELVPVHRTYKETKEAFLAVSTLLRIFQG